VFVGSALTNFGVRLLLDAVVDLAPAPSPVPDEEGKPRSLDAPFAGFVFKIQANMDPAHRDRIAFVRVCSGHFQRGMTVTHAASGRPFATKYASTVFGADRETIEEAFPGDVIGLVNASGLGIGDTLYEADPVRFPASRASRRAVRRGPPVDGGRFKQFRRGLAQLDEEGVVQVLRDVDRGDAAPVLAAVGPMQFEVFAHRLEHEFGAPVELSPTSYKVARRTDASSAPELRRSTGVDVLARADGTLLALFESPAWLARVEQDKPQLVLERIVAD
jgi:peptide chain release factor 3